MYRIDEKKNKIVEDVEIKRLPANSYLSTKPVVTLLPLGTIEYYFTYVPSINSGTLYITLNLDYNSEIRVNFGYDTNFARIKRELLQKYSYLSDNIFKSFWIKIETDSTQFILECKKACENLFEKIKVKTLTPGTLFYTDISYMNLQAYKLIELKTHKNGYRLITDKDQYDRSNQIILEPNDYVYIKK